MQDHWSEIQLQLDRIHKKNLYRSLPVASGIDFCSNDYLKLSQNSEVIESFYRGMKEFGSGSTASRLVRGNFEIAESFESEFSKFVQAEATLVVSNGFVANVGILQTLGGLDTVIFTDRKNHASILDGIRISGSIKKYYSHLDLSELEELLSKQYEKERQGETLKKKIVVTESVFSMDGDCPDFSRLIEIKKRFPFVLVVDEAHALGVFGPQGQGLLLEQLSSDELQWVDYRIFTLGKSFGLFGGLISTRKIGKEYLTNAMRPFIFSTALPPGIFTAAKTSLRILERKEEDRSRLKSMSQRTKASLQELGYEVSNTMSQIIPVIFKDENQALYAAQKIREEGFDMRAIRPPSVPTPRLRISLNSGISEMELDRFLNTMKQIKQS